MDIEKELLLNQWTTLKSRIRKHWIKLTEDDLDHIRGNTDELINVLRKRYGYGKAQAEIAINNWLSEQNEHGNKRN